MVIFFLEVPANAVIQVSYIGYVPQELRLGGKNHLDVVLKEDSQALDEDSSCRLWRTKENKSYRFGIIC